MMKKIILIGCAHIHTPAFVNMMLARKDSLQICGVWDHDAARAEKNAAALGTKAYASVDELLAFQPDAAVICSETNKHKELAEKVIGKVKYVFIEKPLGFAAKDGIEMADAIEKSGTVFQTGYFMRGNAVFLYLKQLVEQGAFGRITRMRHTNCHSGSLGGWFDSDWRWMADPSIAGCGAFGDLGTHSLDIMMWFLGCPEKVTADIQVVTGRYGDCDEMGEAILLFPNGVIGTLAAGWVDVSNPVTCEICGTEGHALVMNGQLYLQSSKIEGADGNTPWTKLPEPLPHAFELFLDAMFGKDVPLVSVRDAANRSAAMEAMYKAARNHTWTAPAYR